MIKWVARLAFLTVLLALVGTFVIIKNIREKQDGNEFKLEGKAQKPPTNTPDTSAIATEIRPENISLSATDTFGTQIKKDTLGKIGARKETFDEQPKQETTAAAINAKPIDSEVSNPSGKPSKATALKKEILLNDQELQKILSKVNVAKVTHNIQSSCVQLFVTEKSNKTRTLRQVEKYLKRKHYTIAGREVITKEVKGIKISPKGQCVRLIIGSF